MNNNNGSDNINKSEKINHIFNKKLCDLIYVVDDCILGDDIHGIILSLIDEFNKLSINNIRHNLEISQYYAINKEYMKKEGLNKCENCEIVLKYYNTTIYFTNEKNTHLENTDYKNTVSDCIINKGVIRFYIKQKNEDMYKYTMIRIAKINKIDYLKQFKHKLYHNNDAIRKLENNMNIAVNKGQSDAIIALAMTGNLESINIERMKEMVKKINNIIFNSKNALINIQIDKSNELFSYIPDETSIKTAHTVAKTIKNIKKFDHLSIILIPNNEPIILYMENNKNIENPAIPIDSNIIILPTNIINSKFSNLNKNFTIKSISDYFNILIINDNKINNMISSGTQNVSSDNLLRSDRLSRRLRRNDSHSSSSPKRHTMTSNNISRSDILFSEAASSTLLLSKAQEQYPRILQMPSFNNEPITNMSISYKTALKRLEEQIKNIIINNTSEQSLMDGGIDLWDEENHNMVHRGRYTYQTGTIIRDKNNVAIPIKGGLPNEYEYPDIDV